MARLRLPAFIIGGAPRCATTWLYVLAERHPSLAMAKPMRPEPKFFLVDELYRRGLAYYASRWFADLPDACVLGEKSTNYLESPVAAQRIRELLPQVKLIFVLRNPVDRAWSNYRWSRQNGYERLEFAEALALEESREHSLPRELKYARPHAYFSRGLYFDMLAPYFRLFPRKQILILRCEDGLVDPAGLAVKFHHFLGVEPRPDDAIGLGLANSAAEQCALDGHIRGELSKRYAESNRRLASLLGRDFCAW